MKGCHELHIYLLNGDLTSKPIKLQGLQSEAHEEANLGLDKRSRNFVPFTL
jgi:hypothetical protein